MATFALAEGVDAVSVAAIMGHKGPRTTLATYAHVIDGTAARAVETVGLKIAVAMQTAVAKPLTLKATHRGALADFPICRYKPREGDGVVPINGGSSDQ